jgi:transposase
MRVIKIKDKIGGTCSMHGIGEIYKIVVGKSEGKRPLGRPCVDGKMILELVVWKLWSGCIWLRIGASG